MGRGTHPRTASTLSLRKAMATAMANSSPAGAGSMAQRVNYSRRRRRFALVESQLPTQEP